MSDVRDFLNRFVGDPDIGHSVAVLLERLDAEEREEKRVPVSGERLDRATLERLKEMIRRA